MHYVNSATHVKVINKIKVLLEILSIGKSSIILHCVIEYSINFHLYFEIRFSLFNNESNASWLVSTTRDMQIYRQSKKKKVNSGNDSHCVRLNRSQSEARFST